MCFLRMYNSKTVLLNLSIFFTSELSKFQIFNVGIGYIARYIKWLAWRCLGS